MASTEVIPATEVVDSAVEAVLIGQVNTLIKRNALTGVRELKSLSRRGKDPVIADQMEAAAEILRQAGWTNSWKAQPLSGPVDINGALKAAAVAGHGTQSLAWRADTYLQLLIAAMTDRIGTVYDWERMENRTAEDCYRLLLLAAELVRSRVARRATLDPADEPRRLTMREHMTVIAEAVYFEIADELDL